MILSYNLYLVRLIHSSGQPLISAFCHAGLQSSSPAEGAVAHETILPSSTPILEPVNDQQWKKICWGTNKEVDKSSSSTFTRKMKHLKKQGEGYGMSPPSPPPPPPSGSGSLVCGCDCVSEGACACRRQLQRALFLCM